MQIVSTTIAPTPDGMVQIQITAADGPSLESSPNSIVVRCTVEGPHPRAPLKLLQKNALTDLAKWALAQASAIEQEMQQL